MSRRFLTAEDVRRAEGAELVVDAQTVVTPQAQEVAAARGITLRTSAGAWQPPAPDRGPDAPRRGEGLAGDHPYLDEPGDAAAGDSVVVTCVGRNRPGVLAEVTGAIAASGVNIDDISQKMIEDYFHMVLVLTMPPGLDFASFKQQLECLGAGDFVVRVMHEKVFRYMHRL
ncbi:MAG: ACT domain-containing protein [Planctomycetes bacterium]|nr:ACT domain-containing protein [Planctomycetota bacterium]